MHRDAALTSSLIAALALAASTPACDQERAPIRTPGAAGVGVGSGSTPGGGGGGGGGGAPGAGGAPAPPEVEDCACLAAARDPGCRSCLDEAAMATCTAELAVCNESGPDYCLLVLDCLALCPTADAFCVDACLGADDSARDAVEALAACACGACAGTCGDGGC